MSVHRSDCMRVFFVDDSKPCTCGALRPAPPAPVEFGYVGGGWFRQKSIPKGVSAPMLHGDEVIRWCRTGVMP